MKRYSGLMGLSLLLAAAAGGAEPPVVAGRLTPPRQVELPALPTSAGPQLHLRRAPDLLPQHLWTLSAGQIVRVPLIVPAEMNRNPWKHWSRETPSLAFDAAPGLPAQPQFPTTSRSFVASETPRGPGPLVRFSREAEPAPRAQDNATEGPAKDLLTRPVAVVAPTPTPVDRVGIVDPDAPLRAVRLATPPIDSDVPTTPRESPPRPTLPAK